MAHIMQFMKTDYSSEISQISEFQNHLQTKSNLHILSVRTDSKNPVCHDWACTSSGGKIPRFTKSDHDALAEIFRKIGQKEMTKQGLQELYNFKQQNPHADLEPFLIKSSEYFRNYIGKGNPIMFHSGVVD